jgi:hypothetical protein
MGLAGGIFGSSLQFVRIPDRCDMERCTRNGLLSAAPRCLTAGLVILDESYLAAETSAKAITPTEVEPILGAVASGEMEKATAAMVAIAHRSRRSLHLVSRKVREQIEAVEAGRGSRSLLVEPDESFTLTIDTPAELPTAGRHEGWNRALLRHGAEQRIRAFAAKQVVCVHGVLPA